MCTICGHFSQQEDTDTSDIYWMLRKMEHRGPDTHGAYLDGRVARAKELESLEDFLRQPSGIALGHSRLRIVGEENIAQPFVSCDRKLALVHNGEIYNYTHLKDLLQGSHEVRTSSDSEVIVHLLEEVYRDDLLAAVRKVMGLLDGMYALAVTDGKSVVVARDPIGKKPVYFVQSDNVTYFASERKALWDGEEKAERLNPGDLLHINEKGCQVVSGLRLQMPQIDIVDFRKAVDLYKEALASAVRKRLIGVTETRLGVIFSGGVDSVLIAQLLQDAGKKIVCYCTGTTDSPDITAARSVAEDLALELKTTLIDESIVQEILPEIIYNVEESGLLQVEVAIPMYMAAKMAAEDDIRVMYTGQAADELFAGYPWYNEVLEKHGYFRLHEKLWEDLGLLHTDTLEREDKLTMAHSIELRAPYLDRDVIQTAMRISPRLKLMSEDDELRKQVHRQAALELGVPEYLAFRGKDPAQSGSGIHGIIESIAKEGTERIEKRLVIDNIRCDKGSLYRYGDKPYGEAVARSYLQNIENSNDHSEISEFLVSA